MLPAGPASSVRARPSTTASPKGDVRIARSGAAQRALLVSGIAIGCSKSLRPTRKRAVGKVPRLGADGQDLAQVVALAKSHSAVQSLSLLRKALANTRCDANTLNAVLTACAKKGGSADDVLNEMQKAQALVDTVSFNIAINACAQRGDPELAKQWLDRLDAATLQPDTVSYNGLLKACARANRADRSESWMREMGRRSLRASVQSFGSLLDACAKAGQLQRAERWLREMQRSRLQPNQHCYTSLLSGAAKQGDVHRAEGWMRAMEEDGLADAVSYGSMLKACGSSGSEKAEWWFQQMLQSGVRANTIMLCSLLDAFAARGDVRSAERWLSPPPSDLQLDLPCYGAMLKACANAGDVEAAERWLQRLLGSGLEPNSTVFNSLLHACARSSQAQKAGEWFDAMLAANCSPDAVTFGSLVNANATCSASAEAWFRRMRSMNIPATVEILNSVISACAQAGDPVRAEQWLKRAHSLQVEPDAVSFNGVIHACGVSGEMERAEGWLHEMTPRRLDDIVTYNSLINACAEHFDPARAEYWLEQMLKRRLAPNEKSYGSILKAFVRMGDDDKAESWLERMRQAGSSLAAELDGSLQDGHTRTGSPLRKALYRFRSDGRSELEVLETALELQWLHGYPRVPPGEPQLTHGTYKYLSGMQPLTVRQLLRLVPEAKTILDPFCGSGAVLIEALAEGREAFGCDASPLAIFVSYHHCDAGKPDLEKLKALAFELAREKDWGQIRGGVKSLPASAEKNALGFALAIGSNIAKQSEKEDAAAYFISAVGRYCTRLAEFRRMAPEAGQVRLFNCDMRRRDWCDPVDAIVTSPPYPGVYNYSAGEGEVEDLKDFPLDSVVGDALQAEEIGSRRSWASDSITEYSAKWQQQQEDWMHSAYACLNPGGSAVLMIGDGDAAVENGFDNLASTLAAAEAVGFETLAWATIESVADEAHRSEVYSFGVVLLELLINRPPALASSQGDMVFPLLEAVQPYVPGAHARVLQCLDPSASWTDVAEEFADLALACLDPVPERRPPFNSVVKSLQRLSTMTQRPLPPSALEEDANPGSPSDDSPEGAGFGWPSWWR
ncbi:unnamed protein product [Effrenium voratum]|nr:unnamed protein product [Effrenium voratum]